ncbi:MAG TPA: amidohydrolase [Thermosynergistes sp.]|nr:amidohydrolase [Thermosynergistes sp.]
MKGIKGRFLALAVGAALLLSAATATMAAQVSADSLKSDIASFLDERAGEFASVADAIWSYAELGFQEFKSSEALIKLFEKYGFSIEKNVSGIPTAFIATWGSGSPVIGFTGEYDALPGLSQKTVPQKEPVVAGAPGHGCGHNILGTTGAAGAIALKAAMEKSGAAGTVKFFGCPAEESGSAKIYMVRDGIFDGVDVVLDNHPGNKYDVAYGIHNSAIIGVKVRFFGKTAHAGSAPWDGVSALDAAQIMGTAIEYAREHLNVGYRIHYVILQGGDWPNIVPDKVEVAAFIRNNDEMLMKTYEKFENCVKAGAIASGCTYEIETMMGMHQKHINEALAKTMYDNAKLFGLPKWSDEEQVYAKEIQKNMGISQDGMPNDIELVPQPPVFTGGGSTDIAEISMVCPLATLGAPGWPKGVPGHSWGVVASVGTSIGHKALVTGAKVLAATGADILTDPAKLEKIKAEFGEESKKYPYKSYIPDDMKPPLDLFKDEMPKWRPLMEPYYKEPKI